MTKADYEKYYKPIMDKMDVIEKIAEGHICTHEGDISVFRHIVENDLPSINTKMVILDDKIDNMSLDMAIVKKKILNGYDKRNKKLFFGALTVEQSDMLWKWFIRLLNLALVFMIVYVLNQVSNETLEKIISVIMK